MNAMKTARGVLILLCGGLVVSNFLAWRRLDWLESALARSPEPASGAAAKGHPELAPYMGELQRLTHKLQLSLASNNVPLAQFYLYESRELVEEMSHAVPEYRGHAIAILAERTLQPAYATVERALRRSAQVDELRAGSGEVVGACNGCHRITGHAFIEIAEIGPEHHPYAQRFEPQEQHVTREVAHQNEERGPSQDP